MENLLKSIKYHNKLQSKMADNLVVNVAGDMLGGKKKTYYKPKFRRDAKDAKDTKEYKPKEIRPRYYESYDDYQSNVLPKVMKKLESGNANWVYDIFNGKKEQELILYQDEHIVLIPDIKWDQKDSFDLRVLAFFKNPELKSIRDLNEKHVDLLDYVKNKGCEIISKKYGFNENQLKIFFHYRPSVWQLHMHFININFKTFSSSVERAHSVYNVMENIKLMNDYYQKANIHCYDIIE